MTIGTNCTAVDQVAVVSGGGAFLDNTDVAVGKLTLTNTSLATVGDDVGIKAGGAFSLLANSSSSPTIQVYAIGGTGFVGVAEAEAAEPVTFATDARVGSAATIQAAGELAVDTDAQVNALDEAQSFSDAAVGVTVAYSNHDNNSDYTPNGISVNGDSTVEIGQGAALHADTVDLSALISYLHAADHAGAETFCDALLGVAVSYAEANITVNTTGRLSSTARHRALTSVTGAEGVDIRALTENVNLEREASRLAVAVVPVQVAEAGGSPMSMNSLVTTDRYVTIFAGSRSPDTDLQKPDPSLPSVALYVDADVEPITALVGTWHIETETGFWGSPTHNKLTTTNNITTGDYVNSTPTTSGNIDWDANVTVQNGLTGAPFLKVDSQGNVIQANGVTINGGAAPPKPGTPVDPNRTGAYSVDDVTNSGAGDVLMSADNLIQNVASSTAVGWPLFTFSQSLPGVTIIDQSALTLELNDINVVAPSNSQPIVRLETEGTISPAPNDSTPTPYTLQFNIAHNDAPGTVDIEKLPPQGLGDRPANIVLQGPINNPLGQTSIVDTFGSIISAPTTANETPLVTFNPATAVDVADNVIFLPTNPGLTTGEPVIYHNGGGTSIAPLVDGHTYYVIAFANPSFIQLASTTADAAARRAIELNSATATGTQHTLAVPPGITTNTLDLGASDQIGASAHLSTST